ncbi:hypothetical protein MOV66_02535 [Agrobacterium sp. SHOUNA12C]|nr:hypothetical protein [Agrobacterium sp. BETTINA12B]MCJ9755510.1 hypothetical protein [Agrobacterium sp. SHOUNA12C]NTG34782.1 hypothetical protein [Rhizobium rhizogenes]NTG54031.1 hypothetical protein [Rhizobium rhizogenes]
MKPSLKGNIYRSLGLYVRGNRADEESEESRFLVAEHRKPENARPRKVTYDEIMSDLATGTPGRFLDRKVQAFISKDMWPPISMNESYDQVQARGVDNAWTTSVKGVEHLIMVSHPEIYRTIRLEFGPHRATFAAEGSSHQVKGSSPAMALMAAHIVMNRLRYGSSEERTDLRQWVANV